MIVHKLHCRILYVFIFSLISFPAYSVEELTLEGAELYHEYCSVCHGDKGDGNSRAKEGLVTPPRDFTAPGLSKILSRDRMVDAVLSGKPGTAMAGWSTRLSREQAESIVDYIRLTFMDINTEKKADKPKIKSSEQVLFMDQPLLNGLTGDFEKGKSFYESNCATCHGINGSGDGPRAYFIFPKPRNFHARESQSRFNRTVLFNAVKYGVRGKEMPAWGKVISDQEIANVIEYVFSSMIREDDTEQAPDWN